MFNIRTVRTTRSIGGAVHCFRVNQNFMLSNFVLTGSTVHTNYKPEVLTTGTCLARGFMWKSSLWGVCGGGGHPYHVCVVGQGRTLSTARGLSYLNNGLLLYTVLHTSIHYKHTGQEYCTQAPTTSTQVKSTAHKHPLQAHRPQAPTTSTQVKSTAHKHPLQAHRPQAPTTSTQATSTHYKHTGYGYDNKLLRHKVLLQVLFEVGDTSFNDLL